MKKLVNIFDTNMAVETIILSSWLDEIFKDVNIDGTMLDAKVPISGGRSTL